MEREKERTIEVAMIKAGIFELKENYRISHIFHLEFIFTYFCGGLSTAKI